jgi:hypothetical protein
MRFAVSLLFPWHCAAGGTSVKAHEVR